MNTNTTIALVGISIIFAATIIALSAISRDVKLAQAEEQKEYPIRHELAIVIRGFADGASDPLTKAVYLDEANRIDTPHFTNTKSEVEKAEKLTLTGGFPSSTTK